MTTPRLSPRALADLDDIWMFGVERWGARQAERYLRQLNAAVQVVSEDPGRGRPCDDIRSGYAKFNAGSHTLFFRTVGDRVEIVRILHSRMDFDRHL